MEIVRSLYDQDECQLSETLSEDPALEAMMRTQRLSRGEFLETEEPRPAQASDVALVPSPLSISSYIANTSARVLRRASVNVCWKLPKGEKALSLHVSACVFDHEQLLEIVDARGPQGRAGGYVGNALSTAA